MIIIVLYELFLLLDVLLPNFCRLIFDLGVFVDDTVVDDDFGPILVLFLDDDIG